MIISLKVNKMTENIINNNSNEEYEILLRQVESELRRHIGIQNHLKVQIEKMQLDVSLNLIFLQETNFDEDKALYLTEISGLKKQNERLLNDIKKYKIKIKQLNNEILSLNKRLKKQKYYFKSLIIDKGISITYKTKENNKEKEKNENNIKEYNNNSWGINYTNLLLGKNKQKEKNISINNISNNKRHNSLNSNNKNETKSRVKMFKSTINKLNKHRININYINKFQKNMTNIVDIHHEQNDNFIPFDFNQINSASSKNRSQKQIRTREISPSSIDKLKYSGLNHSNNRNKSQIMFKSNGNIGKLQFYRKIKDYHKLFDKKIGEMTKNIIPNSKRKTLSAFHNIRNSSPNFYDTYRNICSNINKNTNLKLKRKNKYKHLNISNSNNYNNNSSNIIIKKPINYFRKKTPHKMNTQRREITPSLKLNNNFFNLYYNSSTKNKMQYNSIDNSYHKKIKKNNIINVSNISAPNQNININNIIKDGNKIKKIINNDNKSKNIYKINPHNNIIDGTLNNVLIIANIKNKFELNTASLGVNKNSSFKKFK